MLFANASGISMGLSYDVGAAKLQVMWRCRPAPLALPFPASTRLVQIEQWHETEPLGQVVTVFAAPTSRRFA